MRDEKRMVKKGTLGDEEEKGAERKKRKAPLE